MRRIAVLWMGMGMGMSLACGPQLGDEIEAGRETGACVDDRCLGTLQCISEVCVDATPATGGDDGGPADDDDDDDGGSDTEDTPPSSVSILLVVDNSGSMGEEQTLLPPAVVRLTDALTTAGVTWRLGITTTDNGNPWCNGTSPEGGAFVLSSCRTRTQDFVFAGVETIDATDGACLSRCPEAWTNIALRPTNGVTHPWIEQIGAGNNLPEGLSMADALSCLVPQGISGCGFEQPLESMRKSLLRSFTEGEANEGFLPDDALLAVVVVSDEADCSVHSDHLAIFDAEGDRTFWSNPDDAVPTSAVCWNAGVACDSTTCGSHDVDEQGNPVDTVSDPDASVMRPVARYVDYLGARTLVLFTLVGGVQIDGSVTYTPSETDPAYQEDYGIGPGCESATGRGVPPVRMREVAEAFPVDGGQAMYSICDANYAPAMDALAASILARVQP